LLAFKNTEIRVQKHTTGVICALRFQNNTAKVVTKVGPVERQRRSLEDGDKEMDSRDVERQHVN
jgi:hypothetical protein